MAEPIPVLIIGDGYAAAVLTLHLVETGICPSQIAVLGPGRLGVGKAYGCQNPDFRLNVRDDLMMLRPDDRAHFPAWADRNIDDPAAQTPAGRFFRRQDFARYLGEEIDRVLGGRKLRQIHESATQIHHREHWHIVTSGGAEIKADRCVLALGNPAAVPTFPIDDDASDALIENAWMGSWVYTLDADADLAIIGGGLTAMDALLSLERRGHRGRIEVITPTGILPPAQTGWALRDPYPWPRSITPREFLATFRRMLAAGNWADPAWQARFESLRPRISIAWQALPAKDRQRLLKKLGWWWQLIRYRASPQTVAAAEKLISRGQLHLHHGRCKALRRDISGRAEITVATQDGAILRLACDHVLLATGAGQDPLIKAMAASGLIAANSSFPDVDANFHLYGPDGHPLPRCHALGPPTAFALGDVIGASSIGRQAFKLAQQLKKDWP